MDEALKNAIAAELSVPPSELTSDRELSTIEYWDSVTALTVMVLVGDALGARIDPGDMLDLKTFGDLEALVGSKKKA